MNKLAKIIKTLSFEELKKLELDYTTGNLKRLIQQQLQTRKQNNYRICPICYTKISKDKEKYNLTFGPPDFKKQAFFDELDCMEFFIEKHVKHLGRTEQTNRLL